jgi:hypothetical protein
MMLRLLVHRYGLDLLSSKILAGPNGIPDGKIDLNYDRTIIGNPNPKVSGGLNQQFNYRNWDMSLFVNFMLDFDVYNANRIEFTNSYSPNSNLLGIMEDRWRNIDPATGDRLSGWSVAKYMESLLNVYQQ